MKTIANFHNFAGSLPDEVMAALDSKLSPPRVFQDGEMIFSSGDAPEYLYLIVSGEVALSNATRDGQELVVTRFLAGDWAGDTGILDGEPRVNTAIAVGTTTLQLLSRPDFQALCKRYPALLYEYSLMQTRNVRLLLNLLVDASLLRLPARIARTLRRLSAGLGKYDEHGRHYLEISQEEISRYVAASRQSTSMELKKLEQQGIIEASYGKLYICDAEQLSALCDELTSFEAVAPSYPERDS